MTCRIYVASDLQTNHHIILTEQHHYLTKVMRLKVGDNIKVFNRDVEFLASITKVDKKSLTVQLLEILKRAPIVNNRKLHLVFSPLKRVDSSFIVEKATELGVSSIIPVIYERTVVKGWNKEKMCKVAVEAIEQSERWIVPQINDIVLFNNLSIPNAAIKIVALERSNAVNIRSITNHHNNEEDIYIFVGPEGGFNQKEKEVIANMHNVSIVSLGDYILRAETAIMVCLSVFVLNFL